MTYASIIIPVRNVEAYIGATLASLRAQSDGDFEAIVVDDGSIDGTRAIVAETAAADGRFRLLEGPGAGPGVARNLAIDEAGGEVLVFVDGDDLVHPSYLERVRAARANLDASDLLLVSYVAGTEVSWPPAPAATLRSLSATELAVRGKAIWRMVCTRRFFIDCEARFLATLNYEDTIPTLQLVLAASRFVEMTTPLYFYRRRPGSLIRRPGTERVDDMLQALAAMAAIGRVETSAHRRLVEFAQLRLMTSLYRRLPAGQRRAYLQRALDSADIAPGNAIRGALEAAVRARGVWMGATLSLVADVARLRGRATQPARP